MKRRGSPGNAPAARAGGSERRPRGEAGQSLVLFALAMLTMLGMLSLVVDTGNLYFQRRKAQQAADVAALAGAINSQGMIPNVTLKQAEAVRDARRMTITNGFTTSQGAANGETNGEVTVHVPPATGPFAGQPDYIEVVIERQVPVLFGRVLGYDQFTIGARAVARAKHLAFDAATISLSDDEQSTKFGGNASIYVLGNVYSRGGIKNQSAASYVNIDGTAFARDQIYGSLDADDYVTGPDDVPDVQDPNFPAPTAPSGPGGTWDNGPPLAGDEHGYAYIMPGTYSRITISGASGRPKVRFCTGVYRLTGQGLSVRSGGYARAVTASDDHVPPSCAGPVAFVLDGTNAQFEVTSDAGNQVYFYSGDGYNNIVIHTAKNCGNPVKIAAQSNVLLYGTIYAKCGDVQLTGGSGGTVHGQVIANTITFLGGSGPAVIYDDEFAAQIPGPGLVE